MDDILVSCYTGQSNRFEVLLLGHQILQAGYQGSQQVLYTLMGGADYEQKLAMTMRMFLEKLPFLLLKLWKIMRTISNITSRILLGKCVRTVFTHECVNIVLMHFPWCIMFI